jgi:hypothetical protein
MRSIFSLFAGMAGMGKVPQLAVPAFNQPPTLSKVTALNQRQRRKLERQVPQNRKK